MTPELEVGTLIERELCGAVFLLEDIKGGRYYFRVISPSKHFEFDFTSAYEFNFFHKVMIERYRMYRILS